MLSTFFAFLKQGKEKFSCLQLKWKFRNHEIVLSKFNSGENYSFQEKQILQSCSIQNNDRGGG